MSVLTSSSAGASPVLVGGERADTCSPSTPMGGDS